jgi:Mn2+/Fe2+ NRAMP family transporter
MAFGRLDPYKTQKIPPVKGLVAMLGPGVVWMALAQGSGELIWWPYIIAKYGLTFLFLLLPACLLQYPLTYSIGYYTIATGESIFQGFIRLNRWFGLFLWVLMTMSFLWFGAFASAGGTALAELTGFPDGWTPRGQTLFWAYLSMALFLAAILLSGVIYNLIEKFMKCVAVLTVIGLIWACTTPSVLEALPEFLAGLSGPTGPMPREWDPSDATKLLTAITFAGLGGFWTLFYSYWLRDKGAGMAAHIGRITGPITGKPEVIPDSGFVPVDTEENKKNFKGWRKYLLLDCGIGIFGNILTTLMTCLLAYALLFPEGLLPEGYRIAVVQSAFFEVSWGRLGTILFLIIAAAFLSDTWLATVDAVSRIQADILHSLFPSTRKISTRGLYYIFLGVLTVVTSVTMLFTAPGPLILTSAVIGFCGTVIFSGAIIILNHYRLPRDVPGWAGPGRLLKALMIVVFTAYLALAAGYIYLKLA